MNNKQKWFLIVVVTLAFTLIAAFLGSGYKGDKIFSFWVTSGYDSAKLNWIGPFLFGLIPGSITGFFLFKDK